MFCEEEKNFIRESLNFSSRIDTRNLLEERQLKKVNLNSLGHDASFRFEKGESKVEIFLKFEENDCFLNQFTNKEITTMPSLVTNYEFPFKISDFFSDFFSETKMTLDLKINVINDDGSILSLIIDGIKNIFSQIEVPFFIPHKHLLIKEYELPYVYEFAIFDNKFVIDPCKKEEISFDGVFLILGNKKVNELILRRGKVKNLLEIENFISNFQNNLLN